MSAHKIRLGLMSTARPLSRIRSNLNINEIGSGSKRITPSGKTRLNLDNTIATGPNTSNPRLKQSSIGTPLTDHQLELDFTYNDFLQSLIKQQLVEQEIHKQKIIIEKQFMRQKDLTRDMNKKYSNMKKDITQIERLSELEELLKVVQENLKMFNGIVNDYHLNNSLERLIGLLQSLCNRVKFKNVKVIDNQVEYNQLQELLRKCAVSMDKILSIPINFEHISEAAVAINDFNLIKTKFDRTLQEITELTDQNTYSVLSNISAMFAQNNCEA